MARLVASTWNRPIWEGPDWDGPDWDGPDWDGPDWDVQCATQPVSVRHTELNRKPTVPERPRDVVIG